MLVTRGLSLVLPASTKYVIDEVIGKGRGDMLSKVAFIALGATIVQALTAFAVAQVLGSKFQPPATGDAGLVGASDSNPILGIALFGLALIVMAVSGLAIVILRRRRLAR